jgi:outer membrane lipoprotein-sorting protein
MLLTGKMDAGTGDSVARSVRAARGPGAVAATRREIAAGAHPAEPQKQVQLPFKLARQLPNRSRLEIEFAGKTAVQVYDGTNGWKLRPFLNRSDVKPFTPEEAKAEAEKTDMGDPLIDYKAKGTKVALEGVEPVEGRAAYKLKLTTKAGTVQRVWIDARTFLDVKVEGVPRRMDGRMHNVWVVQRDFRTVQGLKIPFSMETVVEGFPQTHKISVEKVVVNPKLDAATFAKPTA